MPNGIYAAMSGAISQERAMDIAAHNLANNDTTGFKAKYPTFKEVVSELNGVENASQRHVELDSVYTDFSQGAFVETGNQTDVAILGEGFFVVDTAEGERYTRSGAFLLSDAGKLVTVSGHEVQGDGGALEIPVGFRPTINTNGVVLADGQEVGKIKLVRFEDTTSIEPVGFGLYKTKPGRDGAEQVENTYLRSGAIESSNVNMVGEMTRLIRISRAYDSFNRAIQAFRGVDGQTARDIG